MKQKKQLRELSEEELKNVTGGKPIDKIGIDIEFRIDTAALCYMQSCPPGYQLVSDNTGCRCVQN